MGNTVREFIALGLPDDEEPTARPQGAEEGSGLGDRIAGTFDDVNVDSVEAVRKLREDE